MNHSKKSNSLISLSIVDTFASYSMKSMFKFIHDFINKLNYVIRGYLWARFARFIALFSEISRSNFEGAIRNRADLINIALILGQRDIFQLLMKS